MLRRLDELRRAGADFAFETTLSGLAHRRTLHRLRESGYETHLVYLWLPSPDTAVERVRTRVRLGGHDVPERDVRRRYWRSVANFEVYRRSGTRWWVYHAAGAIGARPSIIAEGVGEVIQRMHDENAWAALQSAAASGPHGGEERGH
jgi:predicted ABC-type ATPase